MKNFLTCVIFLMALTTGYADEQQNQDDVLSFLPKHTVEEQKSLNAAYCAKLGGVDDTQYQELPEGTKAHFGTNCKIVDGEKFDRVMPYAGAGNLDADGMPIINMPETN